MFYCFSGTGLLKKKKKEQGQGEPGSSNTTELSWPRLAASACDKCTVTDLDERTKKRSKPIPVMGRDDPGGPGESLSNL